MIQKILALLITVAFFQGCSLIPRNQIRPVAKGERWRVRLIKYENGSDFIKNGGFQHPYDFSLLKLNRILGAIYYRNSELFGSGKKTRLFNKRVRATLLRPLKQAFSMARPDEVVDFSFMLSERKLVFFNHDLFTSGIMFVKDGKLNVVMRVVDFQVENFADALRQFAGDPTGRALRNPWEFVVGPGQSLKPSKKSGLGIFQQSVYPNWLIIDLDYEFGPAPLKTRKKVNVPQVLTPNSSPPEVKFETVKPSEGPIKTKTYTPIDDPEVRKKLQILRDLYNSGAISRKTYERKKEELLSR